MNGDGDVGNGDYRRRQYDVEAGLSNVRERLAKLEAKDEGYAKIFSTKEDVANHAKTTDVVEAKYAMAILFLTLGATVLAAFVGGILRFWPSS